MRVIAQTRETFFGSNGYALQSGTVYGPIHSRRYGHSLGINPLPVSYKFCDFDCVYCQYGWTPRPGSDVRKTDERLKSAAQLLSEIETSFTHMIAQGTPVNVITIAGNGEPTLHPEFLNLVRGLGRLRDQYYPGVRIGILSDSSQCHRAEIKQGLELLEDRCMKLDAGNEATIERVNKPVGGFDLKRTLEALRALDRVIVQAMFVCGDYDNTQDEDIQSWIKAVCFVRPISVQVYTIDRPPADRDLRPVPQDRLSAIAKRLESESGIRTEVFD